MEEKKLRIGLCGFGSMGRTHLWAVRNIPFFYGDPGFTAETAAVLTTSPEKSARVAREFGIPRAAISEDELIDDPTIDVIDVCTPNVCHFETLKKAILSGKHVLCEKPLCISPEEAAQIVSLPRKEGQTLGMVFNNRWLSASIRAKQLIDEGRLGKILSFHGTYLHSSATDTAKPAGWKQDRAVCGGGVLFDLGSHVIDLLSFLCGRFRTVGGMSQIAYPVRTGRDGKEWHTNADESFYLSAVTETGAMGNIEVGKLQVGTNDELSYEIYGEKGSLRFSLMQPNFLYFYDAARPGTPLGGERGYTAIECVGRYPGLIFPSFKAPIGWLYGHLESMRQFLTAAANGSPFVPSLDDGAYVQRVMDAAYRSDAAGGIRTEVSPC